MGGGHGSWRALDALVTRLKTIKGSPQFWTDVGNRVYTRAWNPDDDSCPKMPYLSVLLDLPEGRLDFDEGTVVRDAFRVTVAGYVAESSVSHAKATAVERALKLKDDIVKALLADWKLGGAVANSTIASWDAAAGDDPDLPYGELVMVIELHLHLAEDGLGP